MPKPIVTRRNNGEYSTVTLSDGTVETVWFPDDSGEPSRVIGRTYPVGVSQAAQRHIAEFEDTQAPTIHPTSSQAGLASFRGLR